MSEKVATILALDVGTSSVKAVLYGDDGCVLGSSSRRYGYQSPHPGWAEAHPEEWWGATLDALADLRRHLSFGTLRAMSFTGQMHSGVLLDASGMPLAPTILWLDRRADQETAELQELLQLPPYQLNSTYTLPKLLWLRRHAPQVLQSTRCILWPKDYLRYRMTGVPCTDLTEAAGAALLDWGTRTWAVDRLELVGLQPEVLPEVRPADAEGGSLLPAVAEMTGLPADVRLAVGMGDVAALFGGAPPQPNRPVCSLGSSSMVFAPLTPGEEVHDPAGRLYVYPFGPYPMLGGVSSTTGAALVWAFEKLCQGPARDVSFESCVEQALAVPPGAEGLSFIPYLAGERSPYWNDALRGGFYGLQLGHDHRHMTRAVMEGVAFALRCLVDIYRELGVPVQDLALAAGGTLTPGWPQLIADTSALPLRVYAGQETVTRVIYALCRSLLGGRFAESLQGTFDEPVVYDPRREYQDVYSAAYRRYQHFSEFALRMSRPP